MLLSCFVAFAASGPAWAARPATNEEKTLILRAFDRSITPDRWQCWDVTVSTVDERWATVESATISLDPDEQLDSCPETSNGFALFELSFGEWESVGAGSESLGRCADIGVPAEVARDLGHSGSLLCTPTRARIFAIDLHRLKFKPRMLVHGAHAAIRSLRWKGWDGRRAFGRGVLDYSDAYATFRVRVRVVLSREGLCGRNRVYRTMKVRAIRSADRARIRALTGTFRRTCP